ncbi:GntR family transcriptional regulator [Gloeocapsa sp. PCC 73106]|uniref:GntR family transcriptional regulator n=1 Tax=Gloeocapsa sp. PCC 73106 TaxID=102232 RepID=UPI0002AC5A7E|nr:GntR family transcriptional regulator [Gloeocapsa sp. PCC 73106]ELR99011.1 putative transcriptional regulator [Gloeocapsa sp. PCC 73106]
MFQFQIQSDSEVPPSKQLFEQLKFAIATRHYAPGQRLPSIRQLAQQTRLHRNTISKVYRLLEGAGFVEPKTGSGIYVKAQGDELGSNFNSDLGKQYPQGQKIVSESIEALLAEGCTLNQVKELYLAAIDWRIRCLGRIIITVPQRDVEAGELMLQELTQALATKIELVLLESLTSFLTQVKLATVITSRYFIQEVIPITQETHARLIPIDIYDYAKELEVIQALPSGAYLGLVSLSSGTLEVAEKIVHTLRGEEVITLTAQAKDRHKLQRLVRSTQIIISDRASGEQIKRAIDAVRDELIRFPRLIWTDNYISVTSIQTLQAKLGIVSNSPSH